MGDLVSLAEAYARKNPKKAPRRRGAADAALGRHARALESIVKHVNEGYPALALNKLELLELRKIAPELSGLREVLMAFVLEASQEAQP